MNVLEEWSETLISEDLDTATSLLQNLRENQIVDTITWGKLQRALSQSHRHEFLRDYISALKEMLVLDIDCKFKAYLLDDRSKDQFVSDVRIPTAPFYGSRVIDDIDLDQVYPFINKVALFRGQWQLKKGRKTDAEYQQQIEDEVEPLFDKLKKQLKDESTLQPKVVYGYYPCNSDGDDLVVYDAQDHDKEIERFSFPRQDGRKHLCISDFFRPIGSGTKDVLGLTCVTIGPKASEVTAKLFADNNYADYLYTHGLSVETAEALAELWHKRMRQELGIDGEDAPNIRDLFTQKYRGSRYSFGYPACPEMSDQDKLFRLLDPSRIGCKLTENWQIDPEQSTSALIVHHPEAKYFNV